MSQRLTGAGAGSRFRGTIASKITLRMLLVAAIPVLAVGALTVGSLLALADRTEQRLTTNRTELTEETIGANRAEQAELVLSRMSAFVDERIGDAIDWSRSEAIVDAVGADYPELAEIGDQPSSAVDAQFPPGHLLDRSGRSNRWLRTQTSDQPAFLDASVSNAAGFTVGASGQSTDFTNGDQAWFTSAWSDGAYLGPVEIDPGSGLAVFAIAVRIDDPTTREPLGVLRTAVAVSALYPFAEEFADDEAGVGVRVLTASGLLLAETESDHDPARVTMQLPFDDAHGQAYRAALDSPDPSGPIILDDTVGGFSRATPLRTVDRIGAEIVNHDWVAFVEQPATSALEPLDGLEALSSDLNDTARILIFVVAGLVIAAMGLAYLLARMLASRIARPVNQLRLEANRLADRELPELVSSLNAPDVTGEIPVITPIRIDADGEVAELASAFNSVRSTAVELAASQAIGRTRDVSNILLNLGRRNQQLVGRQLRFIDDLERSESDPDALRNLFLLDQMATRMRRNAESLLVLAGEDSPRRVSHPRPIEEVIRAATGEVEDYSRVRLASIDSVLVQPTVVNDLTHLLAELIENATNFSPPEELIEVVGTYSEDGSYTLSIVDRGVGIGAEKLVEANERLSGAVFSSDTTSSYLGLHVVGRLAARHDIEARLVESVGSGITAKVTLPAACVAEVPEPVGEVHGSRLSSVEPADEEASSWPAPAVPHPKPSRTGRDRVVVTASAGDSAGGDAGDDRPLPNFDFDPAATAELPALTVTAPDEDHTAGTPIPPFRARESKRPVGLPGPGEGDDGRPVDGDPDRFRVRKRVRRHGAPPADEVLEPVAVPGAGSEDGTAESRAAEVRDKLNRFATGVRAAKDGAPAVPPTPATKTASTGAAANGTDAGAEGGAEVNAEDEASKTAETSGPVDGSAADGEAEQE